MAKKVNNKIFIEITNNRIYEKLCDVESHVIKTNGIVKLNTFVSRLALTLSITAIIGVAGLKLAGII